MKTTIIGIALAATALTTANALKCQKNATGVLATREKRFEHKFDYDGHPVAEWTQYYKMKDGKLVTSKDPGEEYDFYSCEADGNLVSGDRAEMTGVLKTKDGKKCLTNSFVWARKPAKWPAWEQVPKDVEKKVTLEDCAENGMGLRKQWFELSNAHRPGCSQELLHHGYYEDQSLHLEYGEKGVAFDRIKELDNEEEKEEEDYRFSISYLMTGKLDDTC